MQGVDVLLIKADQGEVHAAGRQLGDGGGGGAGHGEGGVDLAVLQHLRGLAEVGVDDLDVIGGHAVGFQHLIGVELRAGALVAHADSLALQLVHAGDAALGGDLNGLIVQAGHPQGVRLRSAEYVGALVSIGQNVRLKDGQAILVVGDALDVVLGRTSRGDVQLGQGQQGIQDVHHGGADTVVSTGGTASGQDLGGLLRRRGSTGASAGTGRGTRSGTGIAAVAAAGQSQAGGHGHRQDKGKLLLHHY